MKFDLERVENIVGKEDDSVHQHFLPFPQGFQNLLKSEVGIVHGRVISLAPMSSNLNSFNLEASKICYLVKG